MSEVAIYLGCIALVCVVLRLVEHFMDRLRDGD